VPCEAWPDGTSGEGRQLAKAKHDYFPRPDRQKPGLPELSHPPERSVPKLNLFVPGRTLLPAGGHGGIAPPPGDHQGRPPDEKTDRRTNNCPASPRRLLPVVSIRPSLRGRLSGRGRPVSGAGCFFFSGAGTRSRPWRRRRLLICCEFPSFSGNSGIFKP